MKSSEILREAAKLIESKISEFSCCAISKASMAATGTYTSTFSARFGRLGPAAAYSVLLGRLPTHWDFFTTGTTELEARNHRVVALCLAAAIAESEGD